MNDIERVTQAIGRGEIQPPSLAPMQPNRNQGPPPMPVSYDFFELAAPALCLFSRFFMPNFHFWRIKFKPNISKWNFIITELEIFCKRIKSQQSVPSKKIQVRREIQFSMKKRRKETMKNEANQRRFFLENQILWRTGIFLAGSDC